MTKLNELLLAITRCPELITARTSGAHPCSKIASVQRHDAYQVPEPWSGHIERAPILFVASNPSIDEDERFPTASWSEADTIDYFQRRFDSDAGYISQRAYNKVRFWTAVRARAKEIFQRDAVPGKDFALTELVHCKSRPRAGGTRSVLPMLQAVASVRHETFRRKNNHPARIPCQECLRPALETGQPSIRSIRRSHCRTLPGRRHSPASQRI